MHRIPLQPSKMSEHATWAASGVMICGVRVDPVSENLPENVVSFGRSKYHTLIGMIPTPLTIKTDQDIRATIEYEAASEHAEYQLRIWYGCQGIQDVHATESILKSGTGIKRHQLFLKREYLEDGKILRCTLDLVQSTRDPIIIYGVWLEVD